jgi:uncharacterized membrane protein
MSGLLVGAGIGVIVVLVGWALLRVAAIADRHAEAMHEQWLTEDDPRRTRV